jgi:sn-glycerol 3-phosphate transport system permease protein
MGRRKMVENRGWLTYLSHAIVPGRRPDPGLSDLRDLRRLDGGDARHRPAAAAAGAGPYLLDNYREALTRGVAGRGLAGGADAVQLHGHGAGIAIGKIVISLLSAFAIVYFRFPGACSASG